MFPVIVATVLEIPYTSFISVGITTNVLEHKWIHNSFSGFIMTDL